MNRSDLANRPPSSKAMTIAEAPLLTDVIITGNLNTMHGSLKYLEVDKVIEKSKSVNRQHGKTVVRNDKRVKQGTTTRMINKQRSLIAKPIMVIHEVSHASSTLPLRDSIHLSSDKIKQSFLPGSSDYNVQSTTFLSNKDQSIRKFGTKALLYRDNLEKLWQLTRQKCSPLIASKSQVPGPGTYNVTSEPS